MKGGEVMVVSESIVFAEAERALSALARLPVSSVSHLWRAAGILNQLAEQFESDAELIGGLPPPSGPAQQSLL